MACRRRCLWGPRTGCGTTAASTATTSITSSPSLSTAQSGAQLSQADRVGLGVGIGIGLPIIILLSILIWRTRRGKSVNVHAEGTPEKAGQPHQLPGVPSELDGRQGTLEIGGDTPYVAELPSHRYPSIMQSPGDN